MNAVVLRSFLALVLGLGMAVSAQAATVYKWVDEQGVTHYGFEAPENKSMIKKSLSVKDELRDKKTAKLPVIVYKDKKYVKSFAQLKQSQRNSFGSNLHNSSSSHFSTNSAEFAMCEETCEPEDQWFPLGNN